MTSKVLLALRGARDALVHLDSPEVHGRSSGLRESDLGTPGATLETAPVDDPAGWLAAADERPPPAILQLKAILSELETQRPMMAARMQNDLQWIERMMRKEGITWKR